MIVQRQCQLGGVSELVAAQRQLGKNQQLHLLICCLRNKFKVTFKVAGDIGRRSGYGRRQG